MSSSGRIGVHEIAPIFLPRRTPLSAGISTKSSIKFTEILSVDDVEFDRRRYWIIIGNSVDEVLVWLGL